ncbi:sensor histidine kinase [Emticicia agri]|uniref:Histidine kinase n=1 Tax=Emticicia agri TaxID=2492393 RepID=A0A4Q5LV59_9BACT|nr:histidine kinase [Emticicia agri]RYU93542.1 histidine kinase [Emticicia agri]
MNNPVINSITRKPEAKTKWSYVLTMPVFLMFFCYLLIGSGYFSDLKTFVGATLLNGVLLTCTFLIQNHVNTLISHRYSSLNQTIQRVAISVFTHAVLSGIFLLLVAALYVKFRLFGSTLGYKALLIVYVVNMMAIVLTMVIQETFHSLGHWKHHEFNKEKLLKENIQGQLQSLKAQISPHFLFNSLNSLSTLIAEDAEKAEEFVNQMARVYRYLLQTNQSTIDDDNVNHLTTLNHELTFIESYYHLLKTRYGEGMHLNIEVDDKYASYHIPPLTLQLLVENAVKHNVIRTSRPLIVEIVSTENGLLQVRNNLQKKSTSGLENLESTRIGLANIQTKYHLLAQNKVVTSEPIIENGPDYFTVTLPLIHKTT